MGIRILEKFIDKTSRGSAALKYKASIEPGNSKSFYFIIPLFLKLMAAMQIVLIRNVLKSRNESIINNTANDSVKYSVSRNGLFNWLFKATRL